MLTQHRYNHVATNIANASQHKKQQELIQKFRQSILCKNNNANLKFVHENVVKDQEARRKTLIRKFKKWDRFKSRKQVAIDNYIYRKKRILLATTWVNIIC